MASVAELVRVGVAVGRAGESSAADVAGRLDALKDTIAVDAAAQLKTNALSTSYTTVWRQFEDAAIDALCEVLPKEKRTDALAAIEDHRT